MTRDVVLTEIYRVRHYIEEVVTAATSPVGGLCHTAGMSEYEVRRAVQVARDNRGLVQGLDELWYQLRRPGLLNLLRRCLMGRFVVQQLQRVRGSLDAVRVGQHPCWEQPDKGARVLAEWGER